MSENKYAIAPEDCEDYLEPGTAYEILSWDKGGEAFHIKAPAGLGMDTLFCLRIGCAHLRGGDWAFSNNIARAALPHQEDETP